MVRRYALRSRTRYLLDGRRIGMLAGRHPLSFLTVADLVYCDMVTAFGRPNSVRPPACRAWLEASELPGSLRKRAVRTVEQIRPQPARQFLGFATAGLAASGCVLTVTKEEQ